MKECGVAVNGLLYLGGSCPVTDHRSISLSHPSLLLLLPRLVKAGRSHDLLPLIGRLVTSVVG